MSEHVEQTGEDGDPTLPTYSVTDNEDSLAHIKQASGVDLPILRAPDYLPAQRLRPEWTDDEYKLRLEQHQLQLDIISSFFDAIERGHDDVVERFVSGGVVSPDTTSSRGETPLLAAVRVRKVALVRKLLGLGAVVDGYGKSAQFVLDGDNRVVYPERTALQLAAEMGNLAIVRVLMEEFGADDSLIAPDGSLALRLAATNGHREVVDYLPARRGGAWQRWRHAHKTEMDRIRRAFRKIGEFATFFVWHIPKFFLWTLPKETAQATAGKIRSAWRRRHEFKGWAKKQMLELPSRARRAGAKVVSGIRKIPSLAERIALRLWETIKAIPGGINMCALWVGGILKMAGHWIASVAARLASFIHTALSAVLSWFGQITLRDVWNGLCSALDAVFVGLPRMVCAFLKSFASFTLKALEATFGTLGLCLWYCAAGMWWLLCYIPHKLWQSLQALGRLFVKAWDEALVYLDPKRV